MALVHTEWKDPTRMLTWPSYSITRSTPIRRFTVSLPSFSVALMRMLRVEANVLPVYLDFRKPMLYYNAIVRGIPVFLREPEGYSRLRNEAIFQMEDFQLFGVKWQLDVAKRNLSGSNYA